jgi:hypothetical protein
MMSVHWVKARHCVASISGEPASLPVFENATGQGANEEGAPAFNDWSSSRAGAGTRKEGCCQDGTRYVEHVVTTVADGDFVGGYRMRVAHEDQGVKSAVA